MSVQPSTIRASTEPTVENDIHSDESLAATARILAYWHEQHDTNALAAIEAFPNLLQKKTLLLDLVLEDYKSRRQASPGIQIREFCEQFRCFGGSLEHSIFRALEVQTYLDCHPELLQLVSDFQWPEAGDCLQGFRVVEELGRGALARVYLCQETGLGQRDVVVKVARGGDYEAAMLGRLDHPNIVPIYSVASDADRFVSYICMPFRGRSTLQDLVDCVGKNGIPDRASSIEQAAHIWFKPDEVELGRELSSPENRVSRDSYVDGVLCLASEIVSALAHAHNSGVLHGDLKPSNVLLTPDGKPLLIDFNLAKDRRSDIGPRGGTLAYMPPEQLVAVSGGSQDNVPEYDARSEVYSFGVLIYQLLTGEVPFLANEDATDPIVAAQQLLECQHIHRPQVRLKNSFVNVELEKLVLQCIALEPAGRPQSMSELQRRLQAQRQPLARLRRLTHRRPILTGIITIAAIAAFALVSLYLSTRPPYHVRQLDYGLALQRDGDYEAALASFNCALQSQPQYQDALYQRARTYLFQADWPSAISDFSRIATEFGDPRGAAYTGYCFNLKQEHVAAIDWYERALTQGYATAGLHNNLGISYAIARSRLGQRDRFERAEYHLNRALELDKTCLTVRRNLIAMALIRSEQDSGYTLTPALDHLNFVLDACPDDPTVLTNAVRLYGVLSSRDERYLETSVEAIESSLRVGGGPTAGELLSNPKFEAIRQHPSFAKLYRSAKKSTRSPIPKSQSEFMDPVDSKLQSAT